MDAEIGIMSWERLQVSKNVRLNYNYKLCLELQMRKNKILKKTISLFALGGTVLMLGLLVCFCFLS